MFRFVILAVVIGGTEAIQCHTGLKFIKGTSVGTATINCDNSGAYCYNMTASTAALIEVTKAGCSMWRCMFAQNKCIGTTFQNIPISLCCCNTPLCNAGGEGGQEAAIQPQNSGGWNSEPEHTRTSLNKEEAQSRFDSTELDDDHTHEHSSRAVRFIDPATTEQTTDKMVVEAEEGAKEVNGTTENEEVDIPMI